MKQIIRKIKSLDRATAQKGICIIGVLSIILGASCYCNYQHPVDRETGTIYKCKSKSMIGTYIETEYNNKDLIIKGSLIKLGTDPLTAKTKDGTKLAYAGDTWGVINQDSHGIYTDEELDLNMCGKASLFGDHYVLKDANGNIVANADFNMCHTYGEITTPDGDLIAVYTTPLFYKNYEVVIYENDVMSDVTVLMVMASYVSDYTADNN